MGAKWDNKPKRWLLQEINSEKVWINSDMCKRIKKKIRKLKTAWRYWGFANILHILMYFTAMEVVRYFEVTITDLNFDLSFIFPPLFLLFQFSDYFPRKSIIISILWHCFLFIPLNLLHHFHFSFQLLLLFCSFLTLVLWWLPGLQLYLSLPPLKSHSSSSSRSILQEPVDSESSPEVS